MPNRKQELITKHRYVVVALARRYSHGNSQLAIDLMQEGFVGLCHAAGKFDTSAGASFATYAGFWARKMMLEYLRQSGSTVVMMQHSWEKRNWLRRIAQRVYARTGVQLVPDEEPIDCPETETADCGAYVDRMERSVLCQQINKIARCLTKQERSLLRNLVAGKSNKDWSERQGFSKQRGNQLYRSSLHKLQQQLCG